MKNTLQLLIINWIFKYSYIVACYNDEFYTLNRWHGHKLTYLIMSTVAKDVMANHVSLYIFVESCFRLYGGVIERGSDDA